MNGDDVLFTTGTDEHGSKIQKEASQSKCSLKEFTDNISSQFLSSFKEYNIQYDDYIRTTEERHTKV